MHTIRLNAAALSESVWWPHVCGLSIDQLAPHSLSCAEFGSGRSARSGAMNDTVARALRQ